MTLLDLLMRIQFYREEDIVPEKELKGIILFFCKMKQHI
jgi:hypothetical protein